MVILIGLPGTLALLPACSEPTRYRVLSFFFDGVPEPGQVQDAGDEVDPQAAPEPAGPSDALARRRPVFAHPPYRENSCGTCHTRFGGGLRQTPEDGLCQTCHPDIPGDLEFVHGPLAVNSCLSCHDPHASSHPAILLGEVNDVCFSCHRRNDLTKRPEHEPEQELSCTDCHGAHGGSDRYFLRRGGR
ncbi:MAG: hypothetical protein JSU68_10175 [Phycisphaerales bacterium]|nr:MAG: hypothetical protein JSU68_10175 [Phycisphaerales bacterium]